MKKQILLLAALLALLTSCSTRAPHYDYRELAQAALRLDIDIDMDDNHRLYIEQHLPHGLPQTLRTKLRPPAHRGLPQGAQSQAARRRPRLFPQWA